MLPLLPGHAATPRWDAYLKERFALLLVALLVLLALQTQLIALSGGLRPRGRVVACAGGSLFRRHAGRANLLHSALDLRARLVPLAAQGCQLLQPQAMQDARWEARLWPAGGRLSLAGCMA